MKQLPKRAASRAQYVFWIFVAVIMATFGAHYLMNQNEFVGVILFFGGIGMAMRETSLRMKWKKQQRAVL